jgi:hypothetical protein
MRAGIHKIKTLLGVELFEISNNFIHAIREKHPRPEQVFNFLPKYTINTNKEAHNQVVQAEWYHQFVGCFHDEPKNDKYLYFNIETLDATLREEISNVGIEDLLKDLDFKKILSNFTPENEENLSHFCFPHCNFLIVELTYETSYDHEGGYDCDMSFDVVGYFDSDLNAIYFESNNN